MSGRKFREFVTNHRTDVAERMAHRASLGIPVQRYKPVNYLECQMIAAQKRFEGYKHLAKLDKLDEKRRKGKESNLLKQQRMVWDKETIRLGKLRKKLERDIFNCILNNTEGPAAEMFRDFEYVQAGLDNGFDPFRVGTVNPVLELKEDLNYWLAENKTDLRQGVPDVLMKHQEIRSVLESVKAQQQSVMDSLEEEAAAISKELRSGYLGELANPLLDHHSPAVNVMKGIPKEAAELECPEEKLKSSILHEFHELDEKYELQLKQLDSKHSVALQKDQYGGWSEEDNFTFVAIYDQYSNDTPNRRKLLVDRLHRHLPKKTRAELMEHEDWWMDFKYLCECKRNISSDWKRARNELLTKAKAIFADACAEDEESNARNVSRIMQEQHNAALFEKVRAWREQKMEALEVELRLEEAAQEARREQHRVAMEKEMNRRQEQKKMISAFHAEREKKHQAELDELQEHLNRLKHNLEQQAVHDQERVQFRMAEFEKKREAMRKKKEQEEEEEREKARRLEALRDEVRISVESDPVRMMGNTEAWRHRQDDIEEEGSLQKPLFKVNTFTSNQITSDPRFRLEQRLREAGLHTSDYARSVMAHIKPPHNPRPDQASDIFHQTKPN